MPLREVPLSAETDLAWRLVDLQRMQLFVDSTRIDYFWWISAAGPMFPSWGFCWREPTLWEMEATAPVALLHF